MLQASILQSTRQDILRLLTEQRERLDKMLTMELLRERTEDGAARSLDRPEAQRLIGILDNEARKVERLEMVLAVVGTMKAGKSTVINAIVGTEVLPNRNQPMTALPTLIRHAPGRTVPVLEFSRREPMLALVDSVATAIRRLARDGRLEELDLYGEADGAGLITRLHDGAGPGLIPERCEGPQEIFPFLRDLNDLARLAGDPLIGLELPLEAYQGVHELPVIEVEFTHLKDHAGLDRGTLSLLDTPGHNEFGHSRKLLHIVREQLARASAVLAVLDYTQLKSEAEDEVRRELAAVADATEDRLFLLVNKFDQKDRHGMSAADLRHHAAGLMDDAIDPGRVYPVSARYAYLANLALAAIDADGRLPSPADHAWVEDFGNLALGSFWDEQLANVEKVRAAARKLWIRSQFETPLRQVVRRAARQAAILTMKSALAKLAEYGRTIDNFMRLRQGALGHDAGQLRALVTGLEQDIAAVDSLGGEAGEIVAQVIVVFEQFIDNLQRETLTRLDQAVDEAMAAAGGTPARADATVAPRSDATMSTRADATMSPRAIGQRTFGQRGQAPVFGRRAAGSGQTAAPAASAAAAPAGAGIRFDSVEAAESAGRTIAHKVQEILDASVRQARAEFQRSCAEMQHGVGGRLQQRVGELLSRTSQRLAEEGLALDLTFPPAQLDAAAADFGITVGDLLARRTERKVGRRAREGLSAEVGRLLWGGESASGFETYEYNEVYYEIDPARIRGRIAADLESSVFEMRRQARAYARDEVEPRVAEYFDALRQYLEGFRGDLIDGIADRGLDPQTIDDLSRQLEILAGAGQGGAEIAAMQDELADVVEAEEEVAAAEEAAAIPRLVLSLAAGEVAFDGSSGKLTIGRSPDSTVVINAGVASRHHADITLQDGAFVVADHSTNGTVLVPQGGAARVLKNESAPLPATGTLGVGAVPEGAPEAAIRFRVE